MTLYTNESDRSDRTLFHYGHNTNVVYDEARGLRLVPFHIFYPNTALLTCSDCGQQTPTGFVSTDGADSVVYCLDCVKEVIDEDDAPEMEPEPCKECGAAWPKGNAFCDMCGFPGFLQGAQ